MYNFFTSRINKKAFIQALKEVEKEGYYVSGELSEDMVFTTNMSRAVAALSDDQIHFKPIKDKTLDVSSYAPNMDANEPAEHERIKPASTDVLEEKVFTKQSRAQMYEKMFADDTLLNGEHVKEWGLLSDETDSAPELALAKKPAPVQAPAKPVKADDSERIKQNAKKLLAEYNQKFEQEKLQKEAEKLEAEKQAAASVKIEEAKEIKEEKPAEPAKLVVEVIAKDEPKPEVKPAPKAVAKPKPAKPAVKPAPAKPAPAVEKVTKSEAVAKPVAEPAPAPAVEPEIKPVPVVKPVASPVAKPADKPKSAPKPAAKRTRKKRRRYDADIAGGFDF